LRRKQLNGIAASIAHKFAASAEHFAYLAAHYRCSVVTINLLTRDIDPVEFDIERNRNLVGLCAENLQLLVPVDSLSLAELKASFDYEIQGLPPPPRIYGGAVEVRLVTHAGQEAVGRVMNRPQMVCA
jgi:hypothetical protein